MAACGYIRHRGYRVRLTLEPKPNEPRGDIYVSTVGTALGIISLLPEEDRKLVFVNPELLQHEAMAGLNAYHAMGLLIAAHKLAFVHLGGQTPLRYDQDHPLLGGNSCLKSTFYVMLALAQWLPATIMEFDCHPLRTEAGLDARELFVLHNLEMAGLLREKAREFLAHPSVDEILSPDDEYETGFGIEAVLIAEPGTFFEKVKRSPLDTVECSSYAPRAQELDRLVNLHLMGELK